MIGFLEDRYSKSSAEINYCFLNKKEIKKLNKDFLGKNLETDVLSFPDCDSSDVRGDIGVCLEVVKVDAKKDKKEFPKYLAEILLHGSLHLFGLEHDYTPASLEKVYALHKEILLKLKLNWSAFNVE